MSNCMEYSLSPRVYKLTIITLKTQTEPFLETFPKNRRNKIAAVKSPRLLKLKERERDLQHL